MSDSATIHPRDLITDAGHIMLSCSALIFHTMNQPGGTGMTQKAVNEMYGVLAMLRIEGNRCIDLIYGDWSEDEVWQEALTVAERGAI